jgi:hypothetical protein
LEIKIKRLLVVSLDYEESSIARKTLGISDSTLFIEVTRDEFIQIPFASHYTKDYILNDEVVLYLKPPIRSY